ncbi:MAG: GNAT family N-acetyltransferase [Cyclobacteriaceae bacterium]
MEYKVPTQLETDRLSLRMFRHDDWKQMHAYYGDEESMRYTTGRTLTEGETWRTMAGAVGHWQLRGYGPYAVEEKNSGSLIGIVGLWYPNDWPEPEIKWGIIRSHWGNGYAAEAARAVKKMAYANLEDCKLISLIFKENANSIRVAKALGATLEKEMIFREKECFIFRHQPD